MTKQDLKHAIIAILIGAAISVATSILQLFIDWLSDIDVSLISGGGASLSYLFTKIKHIV